jgi:hypothetical protein
MTATLKEYVAKFALYPMLLSQDATAKAFLFCCRPDTALGTQIKKYMEADFDNFLRHTQQVGGRMGVNKVGEGAYVVGSVGRSGRKSQRGSTGNLG